MSRPLRFVLPLLVTGLLSACIAREPEAIEQAGTIVPAVEGRITRTGP